MQQQAPVWATTLGHGPSSKARRAAATALSAWATDAPGNSISVSSVAGSMTVIVWPVAPGLHRPSIMHA